MNNLLVCKQTNMTYDDTLYYLKEYFLNCGEFINENKLNEYLNFCFDNELNFKMDSFKSEYHHIVPSFMNCKDSFTIILSLTDHLYAHYLLSQVFCFEYRENDYRASAMYSLNLLYNRSKINNGNIKYYIEQNYKDYTYYKNIKIGYSSKIWEKDFSGENNGMYGKKHSLETKLKIGSSNKGKKRTQEVKNKLSKAHNPSNRPPSHKNEIVINNKFKNKYIKLEELDRYLNEGWIKGSCLKNKPRKDYNTITMEKDDIRIKVKYSDFQSYLDQGYTTTRKRLQRMRKILKSKGVDNSGI